MASNSSRQNTTAPCPDCGQRITLRGNIQVGSEIVCPHCEAELEVIGIDPVELDWIYEEEDWDDEEEDEDW